MFGQNLSRPGDQHEAPTVSSSPRLPHPPFHSHLPSPLNSPATLKHLPASSQRTVLEPPGQTLGNMARPLPRICVCVCGGDQGVHTERREAWG